jgi:hypothetical protein
VEEEGLAVCEDDIRWRGHPHQPRVKVRSYCRIRSEGGRDPADRRQPSQNDVKVGLCLPCPTEQYHTPNPAAASGYVRT